MTASRELPAGPWEVLLSRALSLLADLQRIGGISDPYWTLGGGTVLMFRHDHRTSKDIDIFVPDPQYLGYLTPRLSDRAAALTTNYIEDPSSYIKLQFEEGEIDFVASPNLLENAWEHWEIQGQTIRVEHSAEIIAKKMFHRGNQASARDLFDLCLVIEREPDMLMTAAPHLLRHRDAFLARIEKPSAILRTSFEAIDTRRYTPSFAHCVDVASSFLKSL